MALDGELLRIWVTGWTKARRTPAPVWINNHWRVDVGWPEQKARHVFAHASAEIAHLAAAINEPWTFIKCCDPCGDLAALLPPGWVLQPPSAIMARDTLDSTAISLPTDYRLDRFEGAVPAAQIMADDAIVATGQAALVEGYAIFDSIKVDPGHRRRGLGTVLMHALAQLARDGGAEQGVLAATAEGQALYQSLGWKVRSPYASACRQHPTGETGGMAPHIGARFEP